MVNGRMTFENGPTSRTTVFDCVSTTRNSGDVSPARYAYLPDGPQMVLCAPEFVTMRVVTSPLSAFTTYQSGPSNDGRYSAAPSGVIAIRSHPPSYSRFQSTASVRRSMQITRLVVLT